LSKDKNNNILKFPGKKPSNMDEIKKASIEQQKLSEESEFIEHAVDEIAISTIKHLVDIGVTIDKPNFYTDLALITDLVRGMIYRDFKYEHISQKLIDKIVSFQLDGNGKVQPILNYGRVLKKEDLNFDGPGYETENVSDKNDDEKNDGETEIIFEPDFELPPDDEK
jgi:hypothetical protein